MKKLLALLLALCMVLSLVACTGTPSETTGAADDTTAAADDTTAAADDTTAAVDAGYDGALPFVAEGETATITIGVPISANTEDIETNTLTLWIEEQTGVDLTFVEFSYDVEEMKQQIGLMVSGNEELPDILYGVPLGTSLNNEYGQDGYLMDVTELYNTYNYYGKQFLSNADPAAIEVMESLVVDPVTGGMYAWPTMANTLSIDNIGECVTINQEWLDVIDKEVPTTVDEVYEVLKLFATTDCNGNGKQDEIPAIYYAGWLADLSQWVINAYVYCVDDYLVNVTDGEVWMPYSTEEYREALKTLNKWYEEGLISDQSYTIGSTDHASMKAIYTPADGVAIAGLVGGHPTVIRDTASDVNMQYAACGPLEAETDKGGYGSFTGYSYCQYYMITTDCENPELAAKVLDFMTGEQFHMNARYGVQGEHWDYAEEGELNVKGEQAYYKVLTDEAPYSNQNNICWHAGRQLGNQNGLLVSSVFEDDGSANSYHSVMAGKMLQMYMDAGTPEETITSMGYNVEESEAIAEYKQLYTDYVKEARALFISGAMDVEDDAVWQTYLDELENNGMTALIEANQTAYDRMKG